jgi:hypothetical protein
VDTIGCHCAACGARFNVRSEYAGQRLRCVKCGQAVLAARAAQPRPHPTSPVAPAGPGGPAEPSLSEIIGLGPQSASGASVAHAWRPSGRKNRRSSARVWYVAISVGAVAMVVIGLAIGLAMRGSNPGSQDTSATSKTAPSSEAASGKTPNSADERAAIVTPPRFDPTYRDESRKTDAVDDAVEEPEDEFP